MALRRLRLCGAEPELARALDFLHLRADVRGVEERTGECEVWLEGDLPSGPPLAASSLRVEELPVTAGMFAHTGLEHDAPVLVTPDLCVRPPWVAAPAGFAGVDLVVPRGSAFGSGEHASTQAALRALHACWPPPPVACCVDVGTGSGILAAYARSRGAGRVVAFDIDPSAARAAATLLADVPGSADVSGSADAFVFAGTAPALACRAEVVVANMTAGELAQAHAAIVALWSGRGLLVLGGLRGPAEVEACRRACAASGVGGVARAFEVEAFTALAYAAPARAPA